MRKETNLHKSAHYLIWQLNNDWQRQLRACLRPYGLTYVEFILLTALIKDMNKRAVNHEHLIMYSHTPKSMTSKVLRSLEAKQLIWRRKGIIDGRAISLRATNRAVLLFEDATKAVATLEKSRLIQISKHPGSVISNLRKLAGDAKNG